MKILLNENFIYNTIILGIYTEKIIHIILTHKT